MGVFPLLRILPQSPGHKPAELLADEGFFVVPPAPEVEGVAFFRPIRHIVPLALVFEFFGMFPAQFPLRFLPCESKQPQFFPFQPADQVSFNGFPHLLPLILQQRKGAGEWGQQGKEQ